MPASRADYEINIKSTADLAGAKAHIAALEGQIAATKALGKDTTDLEAELQRVRGVTMDAELNKTGEAAKEAGEKFKFLGRSAHESHAVLRALNEALPGFEQLAHFLANGLTLSIGLAVAAFAYLKEAVTGFTKTLDDLDTPSARGQWAEDLADNVRDAAVETATFNEKLRETMAAEDSLTTVTDNLIAAQHSQAATTREVANAQKELYLARLALAEKLGQISPEEAVKVRLEIDADAFKQELESKKAEIAAEIAARQHEQQTNRNREPALGGKMDAANASADAAKNAQTKNDGKLKQLQDQLAKEEEALGKAQKAFEDAQKWWRLDTVVTGEDITLGKQIDEKTPIVEGLKRAIKQQQSKQTTLSENAATTKQAADEASGNYNDAAKEDKTDSATIRKLQSDLAAATAKAGALESLHSQTTAVNASADVVDATDKARKAADDGTATPQQQQILKDQQTQKEVANEHGSTANIDANQTLVKAHILEATLRNERPQDRTNEQMVQLHDLMVRMIALHSNREVTQPAKIDLQDLTTRVRNLESQMAQSGNTR